MDQNPPRRKKNETDHGYQERIDNWKINQALIRKAPHLRGEGQERNRAWRIAEAERRLFADEDNQW